MSPAKMAVGVLALALLVPACVPVSTNSKADEDRLAVIQEDVQRLKRDTAQLKEHSGAGVVTSDQEAGKKLAELDERVRQLDVDNQALKGKIEELERSLAEAKKARTEAETEKLLADNAALSARLDALTEKVAAMPKAGETPKSGSAAATPAKSPKELYDEAYSLYRENKYADAQAKFREYAERYPDTPLTDNSIFWIGEAYYDQGQYEQAILQYDKVVQKYPDGDKVASSLLKQAFAFAAMGDVVSARILLKKVITEHPGSEQASIARKKMEVLGE